MSIQCKCGVFYVKTALVIVQKLTLSTIYSKINLKHNHIQ